MKHWLTYISRKIQMPFAFLHLRYCQWRFKYIHNKYLNGQQSTSNAARLLLIQSWIEYYQTQFKAWGKYHHRFTFTQKQSKKYDRTQDWLFPKFECKWGAVNMYSEQTCKDQQNLIYTQNLEIVRLKGKNHTLIKK